MQFGVDLLCKQNQKIVEFASRGFFREAILLFKQLHSADHGHLTSLAIVLPSVIKACQMQLEQLCMGLQIHALLIKTAHHRTQIPISNSLITLYAKHSHVRQARLLFDTMPVKDAISWTSMINAYVRNNFLSESLLLFKQLFDTGGSWADAVFLTKPQLVAMVISVCGRTGNLGFGKQIHAKTAVMFLLHHRCASISSSLVNIFTALVDFYSRCLEFSEARKVFARMPEKNIVSWTALINGSLTAGNHRLCFELFRSEEMWDLGVKPNRATLLAILSACGQMGAFRHGKQIHGYSFRHELHSSDMLSAAVVDMYTRCRETLASRYALLVFQSHESRDVVMWSTIINNRVRNGDGVGALTLFHQMRTEAEDAIIPNSVTVLAIIRACTSIDRFWIDLGTWTHTLAIKYGLSSDVAVANSLIDMYAQCGFLNHSIQVFKEMPTRDKVSWSSMISSLGYHGRGQEAVSLYRDLSKLDDDSTIDEITLLAVLTACNHSGLIDDGKTIFNHAVENYGNLLSSQHYACYADLLGRGGQIEEACEVVTNTIQPTTCTRMLTSLISACKSAGRFGDAVVLGCKLIKEEPSNAEGYGLLSQVHAEKGDWVGAEKLRILMRTKRLRKRSGRSWIVTN